ncbi:hypothetical protein VNO80_09595 [Phaseolus coccineus]|uniref:Uncharacterized protein n=1 Tax=Phaseolus coccineus TaxID=3886 RepID=A0AAN9R9Q0_PHACN
MRRSTALIVVLTVLLLTMPTLVNCRVLASQQNLTHHKPIKDHPQFPPSVTKEKANTEDSIRTRVLIESQVNTMSSGPSRRGSGH